MNLIIQIKLIIFSFLYGIFFAITIDINSKFIYSKRKVFKILFTFIYIVLNILIYFAALQKINRGILHYYSFICIVLGFLLENYIVNRWRK